ncbi:BLOC-1-related complex subunit 5-like [Littorina saxatilis]|uniref:BLOC-1-related complex subunit 5 n=1 Tax=Littorina saxatilis TaxID=31220 RepID=A0AAN9BMD7_9CAEN
MGSEQSTFPAGAPGSTLRSQRDEEIPYTQFSISKPIDSDSPRQSPRPHKVKQQALQVKPSERGEQGSSPKHDIVVVADGSNVVKDPDPELTKLNTIPSFYPIMKGSLNVSTSARDPDLLDKLDHRTLLLMCLRYQDHLRQLAEAVAFDQNALCIRIKEVNHTIQILMGMLNDRQKKYHKYVEQFQRVTEMVTTLNKVKATMDDIVPCMDRLNQLLPASEQLETFSLRQGSSINS